MTEENPFVKVLCDGIDEAMHERHKVYLVVGIVPDGTPCPCAKCKIPEPQSEASE